MTQEQSELLLKDLRARLLFGVKFVYNKNVYTAKGLDLIATDEGVLKYAIIVKGAEPIEIGFIKPYLRPMSSMTEEEKKFYKKYFNWYEQPLEDTVELIDWLNEHHFDYRNLIEKGLALPAPPDMYK